MGKERTDAIFAVLAQIMEESAEKNDMLEKLNVFKNILCGKMIPEIKRIPYKYKYDLISALEGLCKDISLYLYFPELINKMLIGFYKPNALTCQAIYKDAPLPDALPVILHGNSERRAVRGLNMAEKIVALSRTQYTDLLRYAKEEKFDLPGLLYALSIPAEHMNLNQAFVIMPEKGSILKKYDAPFMNAVDILVIEACECTTAHLEPYRNLSKVFVYGRSLEKNKELVEKYCDKEEIAIEYFNSLSDILKELKNKKYAAEYRNFCYVYYLENILFEISDYLSVQKSGLESSLAEINDNLLFKDKASGECVKNLQNKYRKEMQYITDLYYGNKEIYGYKKICDELIHQMTALEESAGVKENMEAVSRHMKMDEVLLELLLKMTSAYKGFPETNCKERVRKYCGIYEQVSGNRKIADVIMHDFFGDAQSKDDLKAFRNMKTRSIFVDRKKIDLRKQLSLSSKECADIVLGMNDSLRNVERRILGKYYLSKDRVNLAKKNLETALLNGDIKAGKIMVDNIELSERELREIADYGVKSAAIKIGKKLYHKVYVQSEHGRASSRDMEDCLKYLHIAASMGALDAIKLLGDIAYDEEGGGRAAEALHYYLTAIRKGSLDSKLYGKIGRLYFLQEDYKNAVEFCMKADTGESSCLLGYIYEKGKGCAVNEDRALAYYERAREAGYMEAGPAYDRLHEKIEIRNGKREAEKKKSYHSSSETSGYSTYSGW